MMAAHSRIQNTDRPATQCTEELAQARHEDESQGGGGGTAVQLACFNSTFAGTARNGDSGRIVPSPRIASHPTQMRIWKHTKHQPVTAFPTNTITRTSRSQNTGAIRILLHSFVQAHAAPAVLSIMPYDNIGQRPEWS